MQMQHCLAQLLSAFFPQRKTWPQEIPRYRYLFLLSMLLVPCSVIALSDYLGTVLIVLLGRWRCFKVIGCQWRLQSIISWVFPYLYQFKFSCCMLWQLGLLGSLSQDHQATLFLVSPHISQQAIFPHHFECIQIWHLQCL